ncbi:MAG: hypothetical protein ABIT01_20025 [Thermoanaerobaculia bacterium]
MKSQRPPRGGETKNVSPSKKFGQCGDTWGNLAIPAGELELDERFVFEGDEADAAHTFQVTRVNLNPLDTSKPLHFYEAITRDRKGTAN